MLPAVKSLSPDAFLSVFLTMMSTAAALTTVTKINFCQVTLTRMLACFPVKAKKTFFHQEYQILLNLSSVASVEWI